MNKKYIPLNFQKETVKRVLSLYRKNVQRILVADEVGLGKTIIARNVIEGLLKSRSITLNKIVYVCSNSMIADQNIKSLVDNEDNILKNTRLSMLHLEMMEHGDKKKIFSITPDTSFNILKRRPTGTVAERALMYVILNKLLSKSYSFLRGDVKNQTWKDCVNSYRNKVTQLDNSNQYIKKIQNIIIRILKEKNIKITRRNFRESLICFLETVLEEHIGKWRLFFMEISLEFFNADLVIMDEFQRFSNTFLSEDIRNTDTELLVRKFFSNDKNVKVLLLSATPYKIYSTLEEVQEKGENPYDEFIKLIRFLKGENNNFETVWKNYSKIINQYRFNENVFLQIKNKAESSLYHNVCRTERKNVSEVEGIVKNKFTIIKLKITSNDIASYTDLVKVLSSNNSEQRAYLPVDYIKSCPFLLSFISGYELEKKISLIFNKQEKLFKNPLFWIDDEGKEINSVHAKYLEIKNKVLLPSVSSPEMLLWIPPSLPYYKADGIFSKAKNFSKTLIFSAWQMVPRMMSSLISYEVEKKTVSKIAEKSELSYGVIDIISLLYPSKFLIEVFSPLNYLNEDLFKIKKEIRKKICSRIFELSIYQNEYSNKSDNAWYYLAPFLIDKIKPEKIRAYYSGKFESCDRLVDKYSDVLGGKKKLGKMPLDLQDRLVDMALASPAIVLGRIFKSFLDKDEKVVDYSIQLARSFLNYLNLPESVAVIKLFCRGTDYENVSLARKILYYCQMGNLQAMFEEYIHILEPELTHDNFQQLVENIKNSISLKTTNYTVATYGSFFEGKDAVKMRSHYAVAFLPGDDEEEVERKAKVRKVFNSPFRPFVLTTTSIGQEGLDFHCYCRQIVHWNLPSNPIDLEQREGRIIRYKNLAVRQNIANRYGNSVSKEIKDVWKCLFNLAIENESSEETSHLVPFWYVKDSNDVIPVEQIIPVYPLSKEIALLERLVKLMATYRLSLGQIYQQELLDAIFQRSEIINDKNNFINLSPYFRKK